MLKTENWKYCSKIIFKCINNVVESNFKENFVEKSTCGSRKQYTGPTELDTNTAEMNFQLYLNSCLICFVTTSTCNFLFFSIFFFFWPGRLKFKQLSYTSELISLICLMLRTLQLLRVQNEQVMLFKFSLQKMKSNTWVIKVSYTFNRPLWFKEVNERSNRKVSL